MKTLKKIFVQLAALAAVILVGMIMKDFGEGLTRLWG